MKYQLLPPLRPEELDALKASITEHGVLVPVEYDEDGNILDGHNRVAICKAAGITKWPTIVRKGLSEAGKRARVRELNLARRHLSTAQKKLIVRAQLTETPTLSDRQIGLLLGVNHNTVRTRRREMEATGEIEAVSALTGRDGVLQPARKPALPFSPALSCGTRLDGLRYYDIERRIRECERDLKLLRAIRDHAVPDEDSAIVRDYIPQAVLRAAARQVGEA
jgi:hypothetical protein